jgi:thiol:disulfide interchange protein
MLILLTLLFLLPLATGSAQAVRSGPVEARLVSETISIRPGTPFTVALLLTMDPAWHVYWSNPGDSGLPTTMDWDLPEGFSASRISWPVPERFVTEGLVTYGYARQVLLLTEMTPPANLAGGSFTLKGKAGWLACRIECTPGNAALSLSLPVSAAAPAADPRWKDAFRLTRSRLPAADPTVSVTAESDGKRITLTARGPALEKASTALFYPSTAGMIRDSLQQGAKLSAGQLVLHLERPAATEGPAASVGPLDGLLVLDGAGEPRGLTVHVAVSRPQGTAGAGRGLLLALLLAFAGGILLNLMPCVLPVISLKVLSFARQAGTAGSTALRHGLAFTGGVLVSFWLIAGILAVLRAAGRLLGWGFQFQDPIVVAITAVLFFLIGLNLFGVFEIGAGFTRLAGRAGSGRSGAAGSFLSGLFATAVATPCTAPFMGSAIGYALARPLPVAFAVFTALALGMAAPYLLLSASPRLVARLPKPGKWMETLKQVMGFPMMGAVVWMLFVFAALSGTTAMVALLAALLAAGCGAWVWGRWGGIERSRGSRLAAAIVAAVLAVGGPALALVSFPQASPLASAAGARTAASADAFWQEWSPGRVAALRAQGTPVFIDFSARWCLSCQVNERVALDNPAVRGRLKELGVVPLRADWTDKNDTIAVAIAGYGRAGVPLYVYYPAGGEEPVILPELLTPGMVLGALNGAP